LDSIDKFNERIASLDRSAAAAIYDQLCRPGPPPVLAIEFSDDGAWSYKSTPEGIQVSEGSSEADVTLQLRSRDWPRLAGRERTVAGLVYERHATIAGNHVDYPAWEPVLEYLLYSDGLYTREKAEHYKEKITAGELNRVFHLEDLPAAIEFMRDWGFVRIRSVFSDDEINSLRDEIKGIVAKTKAGPKDARDAWWTQDGSDQIELARVNYLGDKSALIAQLHGHPAIKRIIEATGLAVIPMTDRMDGEFITLKTTSGKEKDTFTNLPWHKDCGLGLHDAICPSCIIGIQLTPASATSGQLQMLCGSHESANNATTVDWLGDAAPVVGLETDAGDITLHYSHVLHAAPPPIDPAVGRETLYIQFYPPLIKSYIGPSKGLNDIVLEFSDGGAVKPLKDVMAGKAK
jgi:hypothetical protein